MASTEVERSNGVDVAEVPSAKWGWSRINHRNWHITGVVIVICCWPCCAATTSATSKTCV